MCRSDKVSKEKEDLNRDKPRHPRRKFNGILDIPPSKNHAFVYRGYRKIPKKDTRDYRENVEAEIKSIMKDKRWKQDDEHVWYYLDLHFHFPDKRIRDSHNCIEVLMDALEGSLFDNDYYVMPRIQYVGLDRENPRLEFEFKASNHY